MPLGLTFPRFDDPQLQELVRVVEQRLNSQNKKLLTFQQGTAATVNFSPLHDVLLVSYTVTGVVTANLAPASEMVGRLICVKDSGANAGTNNITVDAAASEQIDGATTYVMSTDGQADWFYCDGSAWHVV